MDFLRFNDDSVLIGTASKSPKAVIFADNLSESSEGVSSNADSDFVDVPEIETDVDDIFLLKAKEPLPGVIDFNESHASKSKTAGEFQVVINTNELGDMKDDIFADVFKSPSKSEELVVELPTRSTISETIEIISDDEDEKLLPIAPNLKKMPDERPILSPLPLEKANGSRIESILNDLSDEMASIKKINLNDLLGSKPESPIKASKPTNHIESTPPRIAQPFFVRKTPPSSAKKSPLNAKSVTVVTPSKVARSLADTFESMPSTSSTSPAINEQDTVRMAADVLRQKKSKEELEEIADHLNQERQDLIAERNRKDRLGVSITEQMSAECMELLRLFGIPYIVAPMEAEAQCAYLNEINLTDGTITDDSDIWLFGGKTVYKNFFDSNKLVMEFKSNNIEKLFHLSRPKLIQLSFLVGSDYTQGKIGRLRQQIILGSN